MKRVTEILQPDFLCCYVVANRNVDVMLPILPTFQDYISNGFVDVGLYESAPHSLAWNNKTDLMNKEIIVVMSYHYLLDNILEACL